MNPIKAASKLCLKCSRTATHTVESKDGSWNPILPRTSLGTIWCIGHAQIEAGKRNLEVPIEQAEVLARPVQLAMEGV